MALDRKLTTGRFAVSTAKLDWVANEDRSRWFLVLRIPTSQGDGLSRLLEASNQAAASCGQPTLYALSQHRPPFDLDVDCGARGRTRGPSLRGASQPTLGSRGQKKLSSTPNATAGAFDSGFHISIGWSLNGPTESASRRLEGIQSSFESLGVSVTNIKVKIGNAIHVLDLLERTEVVPGIIAA